MATTPASTGGLTERLTQLLSNPEELQSILGQLSEMSDPPDIAQTKAFGQQMTSQALPQGAGQQAGQQAQPAQPVPDQAQLSQLMNPVTQRLGAPQPQGGPVTLPQAGGQFDFNRLIQGG